MAAERPRLVVSPRLVAVSTAAAFLIALVLLSAIVLPAAHGLDPLRFGAALGTLRERDPLEPVARDDTIRITVPAGSDLEYKLYVRAGDTFNYTWFADGFLLFDFHGEEEGAPPDAFTSFGSGEAREASGTHNATFTGTHGWYWRNPGSAEVQVTLHTEGRYAVVGFV